MTTLPPPSQAQITQVQSNINNLMDYCTDLHGYLSDVINEVYTQLSETPSDDPGQTFITNVLDACFWSLTLTDLPGINIIFTFVGTFFGAYSGPVMPASLQGTFAGVWERFDATFLQAGTDLANIYANPAAAWNTTYTDPVSGKTSAVSNLGDGTSNMPGKDDPAFQTLLATGREAYRVSLTKVTLPVAYHIVPDDEGCFVPADSAAAIQAEGQSMVQSNPWCFETWFATEGGEICPEQGYMIMDNFLGNGVGILSSHAPSDLCQWLFIDDGYGNITNTDGVLTRAEVWAPGSHVACPLIPPAATASKAAMLPHAARTQAKPVFVVAAKVLPPAKPLPVGPDDAARVAAWHALWAKKPRQQIETEIINKALADKTFLHRLVSDPRTVIAQELGIEVPTFVTVTAIQELPGEYKFVIPLIGQPHN